MKRIAIACVILVALGFAGWEGYRRAWHGWASEVYKAIEIAIDDATIMGEVIVEGQPTRPTGFPGPISISFTGVVMTQDTVVTIPELNVRSFFLPRLPLHIKAPQGINVQSTKMHAYFNTIDYIAVAGTIPNRLPRSTRAMDMQAWRDEGGAIDVDMFLIRKGPLTIDAYGAARLDDNMQPDLEMQAFITGHMAFLVDMRQNGAIESRPALLAAAVMNGLTKTGDDGIPAMHLQLAIRNGALYAGPIRITDVPPLRWD